MYPIPHCSPPPWPDAIPASRFAATISNHPDGCAVALIGLADDLGVRLNGGRVGAREGPRAFREALARYGVAEPYGWEWPRVFDAGDVVPAAGDDEAALHETHRRVTEATRAVLELGLFPIGIGGGHDLTFPFVRAVIERHRATKPSAPFGGLYFDAHLDVRETVGSGMAFRALIEECGAGPLAVHGLNPFVNTRQHWDWYVEHGGFVAEDWLNGHTIIEGDRFVSLDLDVLRGSQAPGVSAVNCEGLTVNEVAAWLGPLAREGDTRCFDMMELCPPHDEGGRTARVAAHLFLTFLHGLSRRSP